ncbi:DUF5991 domain-containing protein [Sphingomonas silueang]|uniref:DUF5991 domain-containing protein n=1 Tax=Sphingomonas silueang TaxID=3156617 RepID=UPI0032B35402
MSISIKAAAALGLATLATAPATAAPLSSWYGRYVWEENVGRHGGDTPQDSIAAFVTRTLSIGPGNGATGCTLNGQGFQTNTRILCTATPQGDSVVIKFYKFGPDNMFGNYRIGSTLLTMTRTPGGIVTRLAAMGPSSDATPRTGKLFRRVGG